MNKKSILSSILGLFILGLTISLASATITFSNIPELSPYNNSFTFTMSSTNNETVSLQITDITQDGKTITFEEKIFTIIANTPTTVTMNYNVNDFNFVLGETYSTLLVANGTISPQISTAIQFEEVNYCELIENKGELEVVIGDVTITNGFGDEEDYWYLFDEIEVEVGVDNDGSWDIQNVEIEWALYTTDGTKITDGNEKDFDLDEGDDDTLTFTFTIDEDIEEFENEEAVLYVKATGKIDDSQSQYDGDETCHSDSLQVDVNADDDFVILRNFEMNGNPIEKTTLETPSLSCNEEITITADLWNIGNNDQEDVTVYIYNKNLGISQDLEVGDIDAFEDDEISYTFSLPENLEDGWYNINLAVYDEDNDVFENSEDDLSEFQIAFKVEGCKETSVTPGITAELISDAKVGRELQIKTVITNPGETMVIYFLNVKGYAGWADSAELSETEITLQPGEFKEVTITFNTNKNSEGEQIFSLEILEDNQVVATQPIGVSIEKTRFKVIDFIKENWKLAGIILLNLILVIAIIIVAVRVYRK